MVIDAGIEAEFAALELEQQREVTAALLVAAGQVDHPGSAFISRQVRRLRASVSGGKSSVPAGGPAA